MSDDLKKIEDTIKKHKPDAIKDATEFTKAKMNYDYWENAINEMMAQSKEAARIAQEVKQREQYAQEPIQRIYADVALSCIAGAVSRDAAHKVIELVSDAKEFRDNDLTEAAVRKLGELAVQGKIDSKYLDPKIIKDLIHSNFER